MSSFLLQSEFSLASEHLHISVHNRLFFLRVHLPDEQPVLQEHILDAIKPVGAGSSTVITATRFALSNSQPNPHGCGKSEQTNLHFLKLVSAIFHYF